MFTGLIETSGVLRRVTPKGPLVTLVIGAPAAMVAELTLGESVAVDGACLTVVRAGGDTFEVDASSETLSRTTLGERHPGDALHLERALRLGDRLGGHIVAGHVDATGRVRSRAALGQALELVIEAPSEVMRYVVAKGSIAVDGVSLTVNEVLADGFSLVLIPHTQGIVHLHRKQPGERVNLEADLLGKYVERLLAPRGDAPGPRPPIDLAFLARHGFV
jgi:riboflavin synthase